MDHTLELEATIRGLVQCLTSANPSEGLSPSYSWLSSVDVRAKLPPQACPLLHLDNDNICHHFLRYHWLAIATS